MSASVSRLATAMLASVVAATGVTVAAVTKASGVGAVVLMMKTVAPSALAWNGGCVISIVAPLGVAA